MPNQIGVRHQFYSRVVKIYGNIGFSRKQYSEIFVRRRSVFSSIIFSRLYRFNLFLRLYKRPKTNQISGIYAILDRFFSIPRLILVEWLSCSRKQLDRIISVKILRIVLSSTKSKYAKTNENVIIIFLSRNET